MSKTVKPCKCVAKVDEKIARYGISVASAYNLRTHTSVAIVAVTKTKRRLRPPTLFATYCPFCGKPYDTKTTDASIIT